MRSLLSRAPVETVPNFPGDESAPAVSLPGVAVPRAASAPVAAPAVEEPSSDLWDEAPAVPTEASEEDLELLHSLLPGDPAAERRVVTTLLRALLAERRGA